MHSIVDDRVHKGSCSASWKKTSKNARLKQLIEAVATMAMNKSKFLVQYDT